MGNENFQDDEAEFIAKGSCDKCGSSDANALYSDGSTYCFSCETLVKDKDYTVTDTDNKTSSQSNLISGEFVALSKRKLTEKTCRKFNYQIGTFRNNQAHIANYRDKDTNAIVAQHIRTHSKDFPWIGKKKNLQLFGQHLWPSGGKKLVITEGEIDAMTVSQLQDNKWPVVSIISGATGATKDIKANIEFVESFDEVIFMFDMDEAGRKAVEKCASLLSPGRAKVAHLDLKDASDMLVAGRGSEVINAVWNAKVYRPDGIITIADVAEEVMKPIEMGYTWPWKTLTDATYGIHRSTCYALGAGTGVGKTDVFTQCVAHILKGNAEAGEKPRPVCTIFLEQPPRETVRRITGKTFGKPFHIPEGNYTEQELKTAVSSLTDSGMLYMYNHFGATDWDVIKSRIKYVSLQYGVKDIFLDHLTALAEHGNDERASLEKIMSEIASLSQELDITIYFISHLTTPDGTPHEEGGRVMVRHFKGSRAIGFWSHFMFGLERDQQHEDPELRQLTTFRILKDRLTGQSVGKTFYLKYDHNTGILAETDYVPEEKLPDYGFKNEDKQTPQSDAPF